MYIYKITNKINNKIYIGQVYNKSIYDRFVRHCKEANANSRSYIDRAINKYGKENFIVEQIDTAKNLKELNDKEIYWIKYYNSTDHNIGYNLTNGGDGGNTYLCKTKEELDIIKNKISNSNKGINNGNHHSFKALNIKTNKIIYFNTFGEACEYFKIKNHDIFGYHCKGLATSYWKNEWVFANIDDEFKQLEIYDPSSKRGNKIKVTNLQTKEVKIFNSQNKCNLFFNVYRGSLNYKKCPIMYNNYLIEKYC